MYDVDVLLYSILLVFIFIIKVYPGVMPCYFSSSSRITFSIPTDTKHPCLFVPCTSSTLREKEENCMRMIRVVACVRCVCLTKVSSNCLVNKEIIGSG